MTIIKYKIKKVSASAQPDFEPADFEDHVAGSVGIGDLSLPIDYWVTGTLCVEPKVGSSFIVYRETRNGIKKSGMMESSMIMDIKEYDGGDMIVETANSVYSFEVIK